MSNSGTTPTADQLAAARLSHWHHNAEPILTINMLRDWLNTSGLVLYTPRAAQLPAPAPSFVEAILGSANSAPTLAETEPARELLIRIVLDGGAFPLNLLGAAHTGTETPDFLVSPLAFPYIFTLLGDKAWKQPPATSGATKVSPLALNTFIILTERAKDYATGMSSYDLTTQLGKEVTESAVLRALTELWQRLRVIPVPQPGGAPTLWELTTARFTKQIKAGANAGQPTALSALISLYIHQAIAASEEEIEIFLSPLASRSRIREVVHALLSARQLETIVIEGRTLLHVAGEPPAFLASETTPVDDIDHLVVTTEGDTDETGSEPARITKFIPKPRKTGTGYVTKTGPKPERERRPFDRESGRPAFNKPWEEERAARLSAAQAPSRVPEGNGETSEERPRPSFRRTDSDREGKRPSFGRPPFSKDRPFNRDRPFNKDRSFSKDRPSFSGDRPAFRRRDDSGEERPRREFAPRPWKDRAEGETGDRPRKPFNRTGGFSRDRDDRPSFRRDNDRPRRDLGDSRPPRREFTPRPESGDGDRRPRRNFGDKPFSGPRKPWTPREDGDRSGPPFRKFDAPRGNRPSFGKDRSFSDRPARPEGDSGRPSGGFAKKPWSKSPNKSGGFDRPTGGFAKKSGSFGKKPFGKSAAGGSGKPASTFDKFKGNKKPWGNRPPARKPKPGNGDSAE